MTKILMTKTKPRQGHLCKRCFEHLNFEFWICFGFRISCFGFLFFAFLLYFLTQVPSLQAQVKKEDFYNAERIERELLELVNKERQDQGRHPLLSHPGLNDVALRHCQKMVKERKLSHGFPNYKTLDQRLMDAGILFLKAGENIAFSEAIVGKFIHEGFMESIEHRQNILEPDFTHCGIKLARSGDDFYVTQVFAQLYNPLREEEAESLLEEAFKTLYRGKYGDPLIFYSQLKPYARIASKLYARNKQTGPYLRTLPDQWGSLHVVNLMSSQLEEIKAELAKEISKKKYGGAAIGVSRARSRAFPGGAYSVSLLLLKSVQGNWTRETFKQRLLQQINRARAKKGFPSLALDSRFTTDLFPIPGLSAASWKRRYQEQLQALYQETGSRAIQVKIFTFIAYDPQHIPGDIFDALVKNHEGPGKIGILVHRPTDRGITANYFRVTFIF